MLVPFGTVELIRVNGYGPEDVVVDSEGMVYTGLDDGRIIRLTPDGRRIDTVADTGGRPLGLELFGDDELLICDAVKGLLVVALSRGEPIALVKTGAGQPLFVCNNAAVAQDGTVYFSDSSQRFPLSRWREDLIEQTGTGRLLRRTTDGDIDEVIGGLQFANGVALASDESFVVVAESGSCRVSKIWLTGQWAGFVDELISDLPGYPDNCSTGSDGLIWVTQASPKVGALNLVRKLPHLARAFVRKMPTSLHPAPARTVGVLAFGSSGHIAHELGGQISGFRMLTGVRERAGKLYFGSLEGNAIAITDVGESNQR